MTAPSGVNDTQVPLDGPTEEAAQPAPTDLGKVKLEGDDVPELFRGKTAAEAIKMASGLQDALRISEEARVRADQQFQLAMRATPTAAPKAPEPEPELTDEQLAELHGNDPIKAIKYLNDRAMRVAERNLESRFGPMLHGSVTALEAQVKAQYADEFALFGDQIEAMIETLPGKRANMVNPQAWEDLVSLIRGRKGNIDKYVELQTRKSAEKARTNAQAAEVAASGFTMSPVVRSVAPPTGHAPASVAQLDATQLEICDRLGMSPEDYIKWSKV